MLDIWAIALGGVLPAIVAGLGFATTWRLSSSANLAWLVGTGVGYLLGHWGLDAQATGIANAITRSVQPTEARDWLPIAIIAATAVELVSQMGQRARIAAWLLRAAMFVLLPWVLLRGSVYLPQQQLDFGLDTGAWSSATALLWLGGIAALFGALWWSTSVVPKENLIGVRSLLAVLVALVTSMTIALSGSLTTAQLAGVLTASLTGSSVCAVLLKSSRGPEAIAGPIWCVLAGILVIARFLLDPEIETYTALLLMLAMALAIGGAIDSQKLSLKLQATIRTVLCVLCLAVVVVPAIRDFATSQQLEVESNPYGNFQP